MLMKDVRNLQVKHIPEHGQMNELYQIKMRRDLPRTTCPICFVSAPESNLS